MAKITSANKHISIRPLMLLLVLMGISSLAWSQHTVARQWNEALLYAIRKDYARPTVHARNLWHTSIALYDAWAIYTPAARPYFLGDTVGEYYCPFNGINIPADVEKARRETMSYAAYRLLRHRFMYSPGANKSLAYFDSLFIHLGYNPADTATNYSSGSAAALGNYLGKELIFFGYQDGSNEQNAYANQQYSPVNPIIAPVVPGNPGIVDPNRWQPISLNVYIDQSGNVIPISTPPFLSPEWGEVTAFALDTNLRTEYTRQGDSYKVYHDPGAPPYLDTVNGGTSSDLYKWNFRLVSKWSSHLDTADGVMWDISPANMGNNTFYPSTQDSLPLFYDEDNGGDYSPGHTLNPKTGQPYAPQLVPRGDFTRVLAEFWADGPESETPPGHWFTILNYVNDHPQFVKRWKGQGPLLDDLEWEVKAYFTLAGALHDAAVTAWALKGWYDYLRPVSALRYLGDQGQASDPTLPNYDPQGIMLDSGYVELVDSTDALAGANFEHVGKIKVWAWAGPDSISNPASDMAGVHWILLENWWPYQRPTFVTPPFAGFVSGHSTFSRSAAEVMTFMTGDPFFPGGMGEFHAPKNQFLVFEEGPSRDITLQWATYRDASDQCSLSRIWGGIHPPADDIPGRIMGMQIGNDAFDLARTYWENGVPDVNRLISSHEVISDSLGGTSGFYIEVHFDSFMDTLHWPQISFPVENPLLHTLQLDSSKTAWQNRYIFRAFYAVSDSNKTLYDIDIAVSAGIGADGSAQPYFQRIDQFSIDMENPSLQVHGLPQIITDVNKGVGQAKIRFTLSEEIRDSLVFSFPDDDPTKQTLVLNTDSTGWIDSQNYQLVYDVHDFNEFMDEVHLKVEAIHDLHGNKGDSWIFRNILLLDMENPYLHSLRISHDTIVRGDVAGKFTIDLLYNERMNPLALPQYQFPVENPLAVLQADQALWLNDSIYRLSFNIDSLNHTLYAIDLAADSARDRYGNMQSYQHFADAFSINIEGGMSLESLPWDFALFPNPVRRGEIISLMPGGAGEESVVQIFDMTGRPVHSIMNSSTDLWLINTAHLPPASYILHLRQGERSYQKIFNVLP